MEDVADHMEPLFEGQPTRLAEDAENGASA
jgi:hypothetical protein